ncbi:MAG: hypothetical protein ABFS86_13585 [Planctomycetota bacterium]
MKVATVFAVLAILAVGFVVAPAVDAQDDEGQVQEQVRERNNWCIRNQVRVEGEAQGEKDTCVKLQLRNHERKGARLRVKAKGLEPDTDCEFRVVDADTGGILATRECRTNKRGRLRIRARSRDGDSLFCGEDNAEGLARARFEICYRSGECAVEGEISAE